MRDKTGIEVGGRKYSYDGRIRTVDKTDEEIATAVKAKLPSITAEEVNAIVVYLKNKGAVNKGGCKGAFNPFKMSQYASMTVADLRALSKQLGEEADERSKQLNKAKAWWEKAVAAGITKKEMQAILTEAD